MSNQDGKKPERLLTFASGGWVLLLTGLISLGLLTWGLAPAIFRMVNRPPGDGKNIETFGFDLSNLQVPRDLVRPATLHRDMVPVMFSATATGPAPGPAESADAAERWKQMQRRNDPKYGKYLVANDKVIGVELNGEARAYPILVMYVHDIINDTLGGEGGVPIAVTYNWITDSVVVFDRRVGEDDQPREFGHSGLVYNSNMVMYDRPVAQDKGADEEGHMPNASLWSQLLAEPISGPAASRGETLRVLPATVMTWQAWSELHPNTTVLDRDLRMAQRYKDAAPLGYFKSPELLEKFPVRPLPDASDKLLKAPVIGVRIGEKHFVYFVDDVIEKADERGEWSDVIGDVTLRFTCDRHARTVNVANDEADDQMIAVHAFWFAWHAMHPDSQIRQ